MVGREQRCGDGSGGGGGAHFLHFILKFPWIHTTKWILT